MRSRPVFRDVTDILLCEPSVLRPTGEVAYWSALQAILAHASDDVNDGICSLLRSFVQQNSTVRIRAPTYTLSEAWIHSKRY